MRTGNKRKKKHFLKMADGDHCRSIMFYEDPGIDNRRMVPATHFEQRGDAFVPFFQDDNHNEGLEQEEMPMEPIDVNEEPFLPVWPVLPIESMEEPPDFLLCDYDDTDDSDDKSSDLRSPTYLMTLIWRSTMRLAMKGRSSRTLLK